MFVGGFIGSPRMNFLPGQITGETKTGFKVALDEFDGVTLTAARRDNGAMTGMSWWACDPNILHRIAR